MDRRSFLTHAGALGGAAALAQLGAFSAHAQAAGDYKALICVFLYGGNDGNNTVVPNDAAGYANYASVRGPLALAQASLLPLVDGTGAAPFALHPALGGATGLQGLWDAGQLAVVANVGTLLHPLTQAQYLASSVPVPQNLFSHIDQQHQWQSSLSDAPSNTGWGGRLADQVAALNASSTVPAMISTAGNNLFVTGSASQALAIPTTGTFGLAGIGTSSAAIARRTALETLLGLDRGPDLVNAAQDVMAGSLKSAEIVNPILASTTTPVSAYFASQTSGFARQLLAIAKLIEARAVLGARRQVFLVSLGSFDTHSLELRTHDTLFAELGSGLKAFHDAMNGIGVGPSVTSFTLSDFSRTLKPNSTGGTDHAWGNHHFVAGGAVKGRKMYGRWPTLALGGPDDAGSEGRWIPTIAVDQYAATLASWFGVNAQGLSAVLPNLAAFTPSTLGFV